MMNFPVTTLEMVEEWDAITDVTTPWEWKHRKEIERLTNEARSQLMSCLMDNYQNPRISEMSIEEVLELPYASEWAPGAKKKLTQIWKDEETIKKESVNRQYWRTHLNEIRKMTCEGQSILDGCLKANYQMPEISNMSVREVLNLSKDLMNPENPVKVWEDEIKQR